MDRLRSVTSDAQVLSLGSSADHRFDLAARSATLRLAPQWVEPQPVGSARAQRTRVLARRLLGGAFRRSWPTIAPLARRGREYLAKPTQDSLGQVHIELANLRTSLSQLTTEVRAHRCDVQDARRARDDQLNALLEVATAAASRQVIPIGDGRLLVRSSLGYIACDENDPCTVLLLFEGAGWEPGTRTIIERVLSSGDTYVDVGANVGVHVLTAAAAVGPDGLVIALEPFPRTSDLLDQTVWLNGYRKRVELHRCAAAEAPGESTLFLGPSSGEHSLVAHDDGGESVAVPLRTLDDIVAGRRVSMIKVDAEGAEIRVLRGATKVLRDNPDVALVVEFGPSHLAASGASTSDWLAAFRDLGLVYAAIDDTTGQVAEIAITELESRYSVNMLFSAPQSPVWARLGVRAPDPR